MSVKANLYHFFYEQYWSIGFIEQSMRNIIDGDMYLINYVQGIPRNQWFADPFILSYDDKQIVLLVEEYSYNIRRGRIAKIWIDRKTYQFLKSKIILDLPSHLSFPFIMRKEGRIFIAPENSESGCWRLYEYNPKTDDIYNSSVIVKEPLTDAIMTNLFGEDLIFSTYLPKQNGSIISIFNNKGELINEQMMTCNVARNAGDWFKVGNKVYRPAQDCNGGYGTAVILQEVKRKDDNTFLFTDVCRINSTSRKFATGCHTLNSYDNLIVIDVHGYRRPGLVKLLNKIKKMA